MALPTSGPAHPAPTVRTHTHPSIGMQADDLKKTPPPSVFGEEISQRYCKQTSGVRHHHPLKVPGTNLPGRHWSSVCRCRSGKSSTTTKATIIGPTVCLRQRANKETRHCNLSVSKTKMNNIKSSRKYGSVHIVSKKGGGVWSLRLNSLDSPHRENAEQPEPRVYTMITWERRNNSEFEFRQSSNTLKFKFLKYGFGLWRIQHLSLLIGIQSQDFHLSIIHFLPWARGHRGSWSQGHSQGWNTETHFHNFQTRLLQSPSLPSSLLSTPKIPVHPELWNSLNKISTSNTFPHLQAPP